MNVRANKEQGPTLSHVTHFHIQINEIIHEVHRQYPQYDFSWQSARIFCMRNMHKEQPRKGIKIMDYHSMEILDMI